MVGRTLLSALGRHECLPHWHFVSPNFSFTTENAEYAEDATNGNRLGCVDGASALAVAQSARSRNVTIGL